MTDIKSKSDHPEVVNLRENREKTPISDNQEKISRPESGKDFELLPDLSIEKPGGNKEKLFDLAEGKAGPEIVSSGAGRQGAAKRQKEIEEVISKDIDKYYLKMDKPAQMEFKRAGEETARKINQILTEGRVKVKKIISLIRAWLMMIPGVNRFFIEQETKIKTDEIIKLGNRR